MATSGVYSFYVTRDDIVREALLNINKIDGIDPIESVIMNDCVRKLNLLIKQWMGKTDFAPGLKVWTRKRAHLFLHSTTGQYTLGPSAVGWADSYVQTYTTASLAANATVVPLTSISGMNVGDHIGIELDSGDLYWTAIASFGALTANLTVGVPSTSAAGNIVFTYTTTPQQPLMIETATLRDDQYNDTPLNIMQSRDYDFLPNKVSPSNYGDPTAVYFENQLGYSYIYTDVAGSNDVSKHIALTFMQPVQDFVNSTDAPYYPQEWYRPLCWGLSRECAPMFNAQWTPVHEENYKDALAIAREKDPEVETRYFQPGQD
jgi:hypothetical protein